MGTLARLLSVETGKPLMRALFFEDDDPRIWDFPHEYFLGEDLLVAPVVEPGTKECSVYLPRGEWVDPWTGEEYVGPTVTTRPAPIDQIPVYVAARSATALAGLFVSDHAVQHNALESREVSN